MTTKEVIDKYVQKKVLPRLIMEPMSGCHLWPASRNKITGYGVVKIGPKIGRKAYLVHRIVYKYYFGELPKDVFVRHKCDNPACANIEHLIHGSHQDNMNDLKLRRRRPYPLKEFCKHGHPMKADNVLKIWVLKKNKYRRVCRACSILKCRKWKARTGYKSSPLKA